MGDGDVDRATSDRNDLRQLEAEVARIRRRRRDDDDVRKLADAVVTLLHLAGRDLDARLRAGAGPEADAASAVQV